MNNRQYFLHIADHNRLLPVIVKAPARGGVLTLRHSTCQKAKTKFGHVTQK